jgi:quercetin dioxygenase-like cupin family protein
MTHAKHPVAIALIAAPAAALLALGGLSAAAAQEEGEPERFRQLAQESLSPTSALTATEILMAPGETVPSHRHSGSVFVYVLEGEVRSQINDEPVVLYRPGDVWFEAEGVTHTLVENASATEPVRLLLVGVAPPGAPPARAAD